MFVPSNKRADVRTGCLANMRLKIDFTKKGYLIYHWTDEHNHIMIDADKVHLLPMFRDIQPAQKSIIDMHISCGISERATYDTFLSIYGGHPNVGFTRRDMSNYVQKNKMRNMAPGDGHVM
ncbi:hypothetical protein LIER_23915 [Lithospermum erythrorhizon]|uniref:FAR1 domain-containing protein n=1 Tax=Lithospermum erythrorhizon TaxID=34254 RepID=A0AAV3R1H3_LITER